MIFAKVVRYQIRVIVYKQHLFQIYAQRFNFIKKIGSSEDQTRDGWVESTNAANHHQSAGHGESQHFAE